MIRLPRPLVAGVLSCIVCVPLHGAAPARRGADAVPTWVSPLHGATSVARGFSPPARRWLPGHRGVDVVGSAGEPVRSAGAGVVLWAGVLAGRGVVVVGHGSLRTTYEPVSPLVRRGQVVTAGEPIGTLASVGGHCLPVACLHWGLLEGQAYLDPLLLLRRSRSRLVAVWPRTTSR